MAQYLNKADVVAEIRRRFDEYSSSILKHYDACKEAKAQELGKILTILDTLEVKEVEEETESIWHDANQQPTMYRKYLVRYSDDRVSGSWERHDDGFIPWKDVVKEHGFTHWCYVEDLIKL